MSKKIILAGFACLLLFLVSVAKSDPNKQQAPRPVVALQVAPRPTNEKVPQVRKHHERVKKEAGNSGHE